MSKRKNHELPQLKEETTEGRVYGVVYHKSFPKGRKRLCRYDTEEARQETDKAYRQFITQWAAGVAGMARHKNQSSYTLDDLALNYLRHAEEVFGKSDFSNYKTAIGMTLSIYSGTLAKDFDIYALKTVQKQFVQKGYARKYCNKLTGFIRAMFKWGRENGLVEQSIAGTLKLASPVHRKAAKDRPPRKPVPDEIVNRTLPVLLPSIKDMVIVQRLTGARPGEICSMKVGEIQTDHPDEIWIYRPTDHKNTWRGHTREIPLWKLAQAILQPRMEGKSLDDSVFSPAEAMQEKWDLDAANRKTKVQPSQQERKEKHTKRPKRKFNRFYSEMAYGKSIKQSIAAANKRLADGEKIPPLDAISNAS